MFSTIFENAYVNETLKCASMFWNAYQMKERKIDGNVEQLQQDIFEALEQGLNDESELYAEAGMLLNDLLSSEGTE